MDDPDDPGYVDATPFATERNLDALAAGLRAAIPDWRLHAYRPSENPPRITVYDPDGNIVHDMDPPVIVWEPVEPVPTMTVTVECSDEWTELA